MINQATTTKLRSAARLKFISTCAINMKVSSNIVVNDSQTTTRQYLPMRKL